MSSSRRRKSSSAVDEGEVIDTQFVCTTKSRCKCSKEEYDCQCELSINRCRFCHAAMTEIDVDTGEELPINHKRKGEISMSQSAKSSKPYYILAGGEPDYDIPGSATLKSVGGKVVVGTYHVVHRNVEGERYPWVVYEDTDAEAPDNERELESFPQYREALRYAAKLDRIASLHERSEAA